MRCHPPIPGLYGLYVHNNCACNEYIALRGRVVGEVPRPSAGGVARVWEEMKRLRWQCKATNEMDGMKFVSKYSGPKRTKYENALKTLGERPIVRGDAVVSGFVKPEKTNPLKENPDPRLIQCRSPRYNIGLGRFLRPIEHQIYRLKRNGRFVMGKCLTNVERGRMIQDKWASFRRPICIAIDASRFDQHVDIEMLKLEHRFYLSVNHDEEFKRLLKMQERNLGFTQQGIAYKTTGKRMSGDMNTASGNCLLMFAMLNACMRRLGMNRWDCAVDGDDTLIFFEAEDTDRMEGLVAEFLDLGHEIKLEGRHTELDGITWCQGKLTWIGGEYRMIKSWEKLLSTICGGVRHWADEHIRGDLAFTIGQCLLYDYAGVPIVEKFCTRLLAAGKKMIADKEALEIYNKVRALGLLGSGVELGVEHSSRIGFEKVWGVTIDEQLLIEQALDRWSVPAGSPVDKEAEHDGRWLSDYYYTPGG